MWKKLFTPDDNAFKKNITQVSSWDVVVLSFKLLFQQLQFWIRPNIWMVLLSIPILTAPGAKAALYGTVAAGLRDPALTHTNPREEIKKGFFRHFWRALGLEALKWLVGIIILTSIWFWVNQETWLLRSFSVISIYALVLWWLTTLYLYPIMIEKPDAKLLLVIKDASLLAFRKPFESMLFAVVSTLLLILGAFLLGPILLIIPALRSILHLQGYWYLTGQVVPGFMDLVDYTDKFYSRG